MDDQALDRLFSGDFNKLVDLPKRLVRLFISSTFTDMTLERNSLMERVYPRLKKYCREKHGLDFQVVDMRWGVRDEATDDHQTSTLCSKEIDNCQRMSLGPNFVALLGDKYGFRPLCNRIKSTEYRALRRCLIELDINTDFLDTWYKEDLNAVPAEYLLQPISSILKNFTNKNEPELQAIDQRIWQAIQERLHELLMIGSNRLVKQGRMNEQEQLIKYSISVTEREVIEGCLEVGEAKAHCLVYVRSIHDLKLHLNKCLSNLSFVNLNSNDNKQKQQRLDSTNSSVYSGTGGADSSTSNNSSSCDRRDSQTRKASLKIGDDSISLTTSLAQTSYERKIEKKRKLIGKYIDLISKDNIWNVDEEAQAALSYLKDTKLENKLKVNGKNLNKFKISWNETEGISLKSEEHKHYLNELSEHFLNNITRMIRKASKNQQELKSGLIGEILQHSHYAKHVSKTFHGRSEELIKIKDYILSSLLSSNSTNDDGKNYIDGTTLPMFIYGAGGCGKTSILAKAATEAKNWYFEAKNKLLFKYTTPSSFMNDTINDNINNTIPDVTAWNQQPCIIMRFCCTSPSSSSIVGVLTSVCRQLQYNFYQFGPLNGQNHNEDKSNAERKQQLPFQTIPEDFVRLVFTFRQLLNNCQHELHRQRLFLIIIDSVERLSSPADSSVELKYSWLTSIVRLPPNVRLIISCSSEKTTDPWRLDYIHLKRHFLNIYFNVYKKEQNDKYFSNDDDDYDDDNNNNNNSNESLMQLALDNIPNQTGLSSKLVGTDLRIIEKDFFGNDKSLESKTDKRYHYLKQILIPSVKFIKILKKKSRNNNHDDDDDKSKQRERSSLILLDQNKWSLTLKRRKITSNSSTILTLPNNSSGNGESIDIDNNSNNLTLSESPSTSPINKSYILVNQQQQRRNIKNRAGTIWMIHVKPLGVKLAMKVAQLWLLDVGRNLTNQQWSIVENSFKHCSRPIFVKLAFGEIINWKSYSMQSDSKGLTFGSSLLLDENGEREKNNEEKLLSFPLSSRKSFNQQLNKHLLRLKRESQLGNEVASICFNNEILTMEQQWLNYLEYKQRQQEQQQLMLNNSNNNRAENNMQEQKMSTSSSSSSVVIRVGANASISALAPTASGDAQNKQTTTAISSSGGGGGGGGNLLSASICHLSNTIDDAICQLFARIELQHGYILTKHSLSYITSARNGICENELEDILSLDDVVLDDVFQYHLPPVRRIPPLLWTRIRNDLPDYLSERDADGIVINWHHSEFKHVTQKRYLIDTKQSNYIHSLLADYFLGKWADKAKPFRCTKQQIQMAADQLESAVQQSIRDSQAFNATAATTTAGNSINQRSSISGGMSRLHGGGSTGGSRIGGGASFSVRSRLRSSDQHDSRLQWMQAKADRRVPHQPLFYLNEQIGQEATIMKNPIGDNKTASSNDNQNTNLNNDDNTITTKRFNMRKLIELPYHLMRSGRFLDLSNHVLFNYKWLSSVLEASGLQNLLADFQEADYYLRLALDEAIIRGSDTNNNSNFINIYDDTPSLPTTVDNKNNNNTATAAAAAVATTVLIDQDGITLADNLDVETLKSILNQLNILNNTIRLSCSYIHSNTQMLAPQLIGRLLPIIKQANKTTNIRLKQEFKFLIQLLEQCYIDGCSDIMLLPTDHCLQSPDGLQLSSLEGHSFAIMSMSIASDQRHLLAISNRFIMWDISTGEISRDIDPKIEGSIMKELKVGSNNEYAIVYTSDNIILALDILTQQVSKFDLLQINDKSIGSSYHDEKADDVIGLSLIDKIGATSFIVWTKTKFFILKVVNIEKCRQVDRKHQSDCTPDSNNRISIELVYWLDLSIELINDGLNTFGQIINIQQDSSCEGLTFIETTTTTNSNNDNKSMKNNVQLITMKINDYMNRKNYSLWKEKLITSSLSIDSHNLKQLVYSDDLGNIFLCRRRINCWSKPKLIYSTNIVVVADNEQYHSTEISFMKQLNSLLLLNNDDNDNDDGLEERTNKQQALIKPLAIELISSLNGTFNRDDLVNQEKLINLADFEKSIDSLSSHDEIEENCVYNKQDYLVSLDNNRKNNDNRNKIKNLYPIRYVKLYLSSKIIIIRLDNNNNNSSGCMKQVRNLVLPKNIRNISVELNKCQVNSILIGNEDFGNNECTKSDGHLFLVAAVGKKLLIFNVLNEEFLKTIDAHNGRIVQIIPIHNLNNNKDNSILTTKNKVKKQQQLTIASASMDKTVKIWNLLNVDKDFYNLDKMASSIETICVSKQRPLAACIARGELGLWDWRTLKLITKTVSLSDLFLSTNQNEDNYHNQKERETLANAMPTNKHKNGQEEKEIKTTTKIVRCCFSFNGRYLFLATLDSVCLLSIESQSTSSVQAPSSSSFLSSNDKINLKLSFRHHLFKNNSPLLQQSNADNSIGISNTNKRDIKTALTRKLTFFLQDSRVLTILECNSFNINDGALFNNNTKRRLSSFDQHSEQTTTTTTTTSGELQLSARLLLLCHSIPDGRLVYKIECLTPILTGNSATQSGPTNNNNYSAAGDDDALRGRTSGVALEASLATSSSSEGAANEKLSTIGNNKIRLPVLTRDQLHIVTVESFSTNNNDNNNVETTTRRKSASTMTRTPICLNIYSARDGLLIRSINLSHLEAWSSPQQISQIISANQQLEAATTTTSPANVSADANNNRARKSSIAELYKAKADKQQRQGSLILPANSSSYNNKALPSSSTSSTQQQQQQQTISIGNEQFTRLKAITYRERQSVVALLDDQQGFSYLIDVQTKLLMASSSVWNGKISSDGRYGLSRMFKTTTAFVNVSSASKVITNSKRKEHALAGQQSSDGISDDNNNNNSMAAASSGGGGGGCSGSGLQLLEMRHFSSVKSLLTNEMRTKLSTLASAQAATGNDTDVTCGFTKPNDSYVYYYDSRLSRLLLIRLRDGQLVANYKLSSLVTKIKCSNDGYALILAHADGSLTSLAIVDPQKNDSLLKLAQYPSRNKG